jgi:acetyl-CoA carboxylase biotin carboxyl carrier protein
MKKKSTKTITKSNSVNAVSNTKTGLISNMQDIQELIKFVSKSGIEALELESGNIKLNIKVHSSGTFNANPIPALNVPQIPVSTQPVSISVPVSESKNQAASASDSKLQTIKSPMIGTFYRSPGPDKPVFVNVGDSIQMGKTVCIIEAMKLFNEIESDIKGKIVKILVDDATPVEYDQPLFLVDPS